MVEDAPGAVVELGLRDETAAERGSGSAYYPTEAAAKRAEIIARLQDISRDARGAIGSSQRSRELRSKLVGEYFDAQSELAHVKEGLAKGVFRERAGEFQQQEDTSDDLYLEALNQYHQLQDAATTDTGRFNAELFNQRLEILANSWTPAQRLFVRANTHTLPVPAGLLRILPEKTRERIRLSEIARANQLKARATQRNRMGVR